MKMTFELVPFSPEIGRGYVNLLPEQEHDVAQGKLDWKFSNNPAGAGMIAVARDSEGRILGLNGFVPSRFRAEGARTIGYQSMDTIVSPEARGMGVFGKLINRFYEQSDGGLLYGFPNLNSSPAFFGKLGWSSFGPAPMLVRPLRTGLFLGRIARFLPDVALPIIGPRARDAREIAVFDDTATQAWQRFSTPIGYAVERDADYLNWRLRDHPSASYSTIQATDGSFVVGTVADKHEAKIGYAMEAIGKGPTLSRLLREMLHRMRGAGAECAFAWCLPWSPNYRAFRAAGFYPFPARLRPIVINFGARPLAAGGEGVRDPRQWYISYLDSDTA